MDSRAARKPRLIMAFGVFLTPLVLYLVSFQVFAFKTFHTSSTVPLKMSISYAAALAILIAIARKSPALIWLIGFLFLLFLVITIVIYARTPSILVTSQEAKSWLDKELRLGADRQAIMGFIERHKTTHQNLRTFGNGTTTYIALTYMNNEGFACGWPDYEVLFKLDRANRYLGYSVEERLDCL